MDYFIGYTMQEKLALLRGIQEAMLTGQVVRINLGGGKQTEFAPANPELAYRRLCDSIANDPNYDANDPVQAACAAGKRPGYTLPVFQ